MLNQTISMQDMMTVVLAVTTVYFAIRNNGRQSSTDIAQKATETAIINQKLDNIGSDVTDIKKDISSVRSDVRELNERMVIVEQSVKSAHKRIDSVEDLPMKGRGRLFGR